MSIFNMVLPTPKVDYINKRETIATSSTSITFGGVFAIPSFYIVVKEPSTTALTSQSENIAWGLLYSSNTRCYMSLVSGKVHVVYDTTDISVTLSNNSMVITMPVTVGEKYCVYYSYETINRAVTSITNLSTSVYFDGIPSDSYSKFALLLQRSSSNDLGIQHGYYVRKDSDPLQAIGYASLDQTYFTTTLQIREPFNSYSITEHYEPYLYRLYFSATENLFGSGTYTLYYA